MTDTVRTTSALQILLGDGQPAHSTNRQLLRDLAASFDVVRRREINVQDAPFNAKGDGSADDLVPLNNAWTALVAQGGGMLRIPRGAYKHSGNLLWEVPVGPMTCDVSFERGAVLMPTAAVTQALTLNTNTSVDGSTNALHVRGLKIDGVNTSGAKLVAVGDNAISGYITLEKFEILRAQGAGGQGLWVKNATTCLFDSGYVGRCETNVIIKPTDGALPTVLEFRSLKSREAVQTTPGTNGNGVEIWGTHDTTFSGKTVIESNFGRGIWVVPIGSSDVLWLEIEKLWMENNCRFDATQYELHVDGSGSTGTIECDVNKGIWNSTARSIYMKSCHNVTLNRIRSRASAGSVLIDTGVNGFMENWPHNNVVYTTAVTNNSPNTFIMRDAGYGRTLTDMATGSISVISGTPNLGSAGNRFGKAFFSMAATNYAQPVYGTTTTPDASTGNVQQINVTDGVAWTLANATNPSLAEFLNIQIRNTSGGAMGAVTLGSEYRMAAIPAIANGQNRSFFFFRDPGNNKWVEITRSPADVPN